MNKFLHVGFHWQGPPKITELEPVFGKAFDWVRYSGNCWIIYTNTDIPTWVARVREHMGPNDNVIICELANIRSSDGWMPKWIWDWVNKSR